MTAGEAWLEKPSWSTCKIGSRGYYWAVWPSYGAWVAQERPTADGIAPTRSAAQLAAYAAGAGPQADAFFASAYRRRLAAEQRSERRSERLAAAGVSVITNRLREP